MVIFKEKAKVEHDMHVRYDYTKYSGILFFFLKTIYGVQYNRPLVRFEDKYNYSLASLFLKIGVEKYRIVMHRYHNGQH